MTAPFGRRRGGPRPVPDQEFRAMPVLDRLAAWREGRLDEEQERQLVEAFERSAPEPPADDRQDRQDRQDRLDRQEDQPPPPEPFMSFEEFVESGLHLVDDGDDVGGAPTPRAADFDLPPEFEERLRLLRPELYPEPDEDDDEPGGPGGPGGPGPSRDAGRSWVEDEPPGGGVLGR